MTNGFKEELYTVRRLIHLFTQLMHDSSHNTLYNYTALHSIGWDQVWLMSTSLQTNLIVKFTEINNLNFSFQKIKIKAYHPDFLNLNYIWVSRNISLCQSRIEDIYFSQICDLNMFSNAKVTFYVFLLYLRSRTGCQKSRYATYTCFCVFQGSLCAVYMCFGEIFKIALETKL